MAAIDKDFPLPLRVLDLCNPIPPKIHPKSGKTNKQIPQLQIRFHRIERSFRHNLQLDSHIYGK